MQTKINNLASCMAATTIVACVSLTVSGWLMADTETHNTGMNHSAPVRMDHAEMDHAEMDHAEMDRPAQGRMDHSMHQQMLKQKGYSRKQQEDRLPQVTLTDQNGEKVFLPDLLAGDDPVMMNFIYTTCVTICPVLSASFSDVQESLGSEADNVRMVSISIDPEHDTPQKMKEYAKRYHAREDWTFLTGGLADTVDVLKAFDAYRRDKMNHIPLTFMRNSAQENWTRLEGFPSVAELMIEYHAL